MQRVRVIDRAIHRVTEFPTVSQFLTTDSVPAGISSIYDGKIPIDLLISPLPSATTTVFFFHGAVEPHFQLPVLSGLGISGGLEANRVFISDPSLILDEELMLSWYAGNVYQPGLQRNLVRIMRKIATDLGTERLVFFGGSGGGFAALHFASYFRSSLALVFNPQTSIAKYSEQAVYDYVEKGFSLGLRDAEPVSQLPSEVIHDLCVHYQNHRRCQIAYLQNLHDKTHVNNHLMPFLKSIHPSTNILLLREYWRDGHRPPPKELLAEALSRAVSSSDWTETFMDLGFVAPQSQESACSSRMV